MVPSCHPQQSKFSRKKIQLARLLRLSSTSVLSYWNFSANKSMGTVTSVIHYAMVVYFTVSDNFYSAMLALKHPFQVCYTD